MTADSRAGEREELAQLLYMAYNQYGRTGKLRAITREEAADFLLSKGVRLASAPGVPESGPGKEMLGAILHEAQRRRSWDDANLEEWWQILQRVTALYGAASGVPGAREPSEEAITAYIAAENEGVHHTDEAWADVVRRGLKAAYAIDRAALPAPKAPGYIRGWADATDHESPRENGADYLMGYAAGYEAKLVLRVAYQVEREPARCQAVESLVKWVEEWTGWAARDARCGRDVNPGLVRGWQLAQDVRAALPRREGEAT